jgi:putative membrane protein
MSLDHDPRVYFAAERTLLAWLRTGMAVIGLGFVVAKFGLFLRLAAGEMLSQAWQWQSTAIGVGLVVLGTAAVASGAWKHVQYCRTLGPNERPPKLWLGSAVWFAVALAILGALLAIYVAVTPAIGSNRAV